MISCKRNTSIRATSLQARHKVRMGPMHARMSALLALLVVQGLWSTAVVAQTMAAPAAVPFLQQELMTPEPSSSHVWIPGARERMGKP